MTANTITWSQIEAECDDYRAGFVAVFKRYEGRDTDEIAGNGHIVRVTKTSFARHMKIPESTFKEWVKTAAAAPTSRSRDRVREGIQRMAPQDRAALAKELLPEAPPAAVAQRAAEKDVARAIARNDTSREAVEDEAIEHRAARHRLNVPDPQEAGESARRAMGKAVGDESDQATDYLNGAASDIANAIVCKDRWGIQFPDAEATALDRIDHILAAYRTTSTAKLSGEDRNWLESIGVDL